MDDVADELTSPHRFLPMTDSGWYRDEASFCAQPLKETTKPGQDTYFMSDSTTPVDAFDDPFAADIPVANRIMTISESAVARLETLIAAEGNPDLMLRITVSGGGCSGFQYGFDFDAATQEDDVTFERDGVRIVTDTTSLDLLAGSELDYVDDLVGAYFRVHNPNATASCGCGTSFAV